MADARTTSHVDHYMEGNVQLSNGKTLGWLNEYLSRTGAGAVDLVGAALTANNFISDVALGTSPFACTSSTLNSNLNADLLDGEHAAAFQDVDATLTSLALLGTAADKIAYTTGIDTWAETGLTAFARSFLDDADEATFKATVNLESGVDVQAYHANLASLAALAYASTSFVKMTAAGTFALDTNTYQVAGSFQPLDATLTSIALLGTAADKMLYTTALDVWAEASLTAAGRAILDDATAAAQATTLGLGTANVPQFAGLGIGGAGAAARLLLTGAPTTDPWRQMVQITNTSAANNARAELAITNNAALRILLSAPSSTYAEIASWQNVGVLYLANGGVVSVPAGGLRFEYGGSFTLSANMANTGIWTFSKDTYFSGNVAIGAGGAGVDYTLTFNGETNDLVATWYEDEAILGLAAADVMLASGKKLILDGSLTGDTWIDESAANVLKLSAGGSEATLSAGQFTIPTAFAVGANVGVTATYVVGLADLPVTIVVVGGLVISIG